jgi:hypothetical protein
MFDTLKTLQAQAADRRIIDLFDADANRADDFSVRMGELLFDYSKTNIDATSRQALIDLALSRGVGEKRDAMFRGDKINDTENRAVLHTALRNLNATPVMVDGQDVMPDVLDTLARMEQFAHAVRSGAYQGQGGTIRDVVNIGIGGSDLGPVMACAALAPYHDGPNCHFVSNVDGAHVADVLAPLDPATTLIIVASKTFTTIETMTNAKTAFDWMAQSVGDPAKQFVACRPRVTKPRPLAYQMIACSGLPIGWAGVIPCGDQSGCPSCWRWALIISANFWPVRRIWMCIFNPRQWIKICPFYWHWLAFGTTKFAAMPPVQYCPMNSGCCVCLPICSSWKWKVTAKACPLMAQICPIIRGRSSGANPVPMGNTHFTS